jgi:cysteinyl-tRNA synthetase
VHYRNDFNFNEEDLLNAKKRLDKLYRLKKRVSPGKGSAVNKEFKNALLSAMSDDLNISTALAVIDEMIANTNDSFDKEAKSKPLKGSASKPLNGASYKALKKETLANIEFIDTLLGFGGQEPFTYFQIGISEEEKAKIETLITQRSEAKKEKNFERSDAIRDELISMGISIMDTPDGTVWEKS